MSRKRNRLLAAGAAVAAAGAVVVAVAPSALAADQVVLHHRTSAAAAAVDQVEPWFKLANTGSTAVPLTELKIRYYFTPDTPDTGYRYACSWAWRGCSTLTGSFGTLSSGVQYLEVGFTTGSLAPGADTGDMQLRFYRANWSKIDQSDDYSFRTDAAYSPWSKVTVHRGGTTLWGTAPGGTAPTTTTTRPGTTTTTPPTTGQPPTGPALFDDFDYASSADPRLAQRGWTVRSGGGGPGVPNASWDPSLVTFQGSGSGKAMRLEASNNGTSARQTEVYHKRKFFEGTYAARVQFSDTPVRGVDGDQVVQTFFTITPLDRPMDPNYGEIDFEYLPNGGWGESNHTMFETTWETYQNDPWLADNTHTAQRASFAGWRDLVVQVADGRVRYYIDGALVADHGDRYYPETPMSINFNQWFIAGGLVGGSGERAYHQNVDWVYFAKDRVLSPAQVQAQVNGYRATGVTHADTV